jgi:hypothetical protein
MNRRTTMKASTKYAIEEARRYFYPDANLIRVAKNNAVALAKAMQTSEEAARFWRREYAMWVEIAGVLTGGSP